MDFKFIDDTITVCGQISEADVAEIAARGFELIINNRPDGEVEGQPTSTEIEAWALSHGIAYHFLPVRSRQMTLEQVAAFGEVYGQAKGPVLAFCRSGMRSSILWALTMAAVGGMPVVEILDRAGKVGYDLSSMTSALEGLRDANSG